MEWLVDLGNEESMRAARRFGFQWKGYQMGGSERFWYSNILNYEWKEIKREYGRWLDGENFDQ